jgi:hypothetical protein
LVLFIFSLVLTLHLQSDIGLFCLCFAIYIEWKPLNENYLIGQKLQAKKDGGQIVNLKK